MPIRFITVKNSVLGDYSVQVNLQTDDPQAVANQIIEDEIYELQPSEFITYSEEDNEDHLFIGSAIFIHRGKKIQIDFKDTDIENTELAYSRAKSELLDHYKKGVSKKYCALSNIVQVNLEKLFSEIDDKDELIEQKIA